VNIFAVDKNPFICARALDDRRVVKMTTETAQILSDAMYLRGDVGFYRKNNPNHPCVKWAAASSVNYQWTIALLLYLNTEYRYRYLKNDDHLAKKKALIPALNYTGIKTLTYILSHAFTGNLDALSIEFQNCSLFKDELDVCLAYRKTLIYKWAHFKAEPRWTRIAKPNWGNL
jgi:hypothetical protein